MTPKDHSALKINTPFSPLPPFQHREWLLWRMADGRSTRIVAAARRLEKIREENEVKKRLLCVLSNHPVLRTAFDAEVPRACFSPLFDVPLAVNHARPDEKLASAVERCAGEAARDPFLLGEVPALRAILVHAGFGEFRQAALLLVAHASIADERSLEYVLKEIDDPVATLQADEDFFSWAQKFQSAEAKENNDRKLRAYIRPPLFNPDASCDEISVPADLHCAAEEFAAAEGATLAEVVLAALAGYRELFRQTGWTIVKEANTSGSPDDLAKIRLAPKFSRYAAEDLLVSFSWLVTRPC